MDTVTFAAVGDISFAGSQADIPCTDILHELQEVWAGASLVCANLEGPLVTGGTPVLGKCTLRSAPEWAVFMREAGINVVSLANNHIMDYGVAGLESTLQALDAAGIRHVGAGRDIAEAQSPLFLECNGLQVAILARTSVVVSSPSYAGVGQAGVAWLDEVETLASITACRRQADLVVLLVHWGMEEHCYPTPTQRHLARRFVEAGIDLILGHHPHVLQGYERLGNAAVAYSLGNLILDDFEWCMVAKDGEEKIVQVQMQRENRTGVVLRGRLVNNGVADLELLPTEFPRGGPVRPESSPEVWKRLHRLNKAFSLPWYPTLWRLYAAKMEWELRFKPRLFSEGILHRLIKLRPRHLLELVSMIRRSSRVASGRTTNPYE